MNISQYGARKRTILWHALVVAVGLTLCCVGCASEEPKQTTTGLTGLPDPLASQKKEHEIIDELREQAARQFAGLSKSESAETMGQLAAAVNSLQKDRSWGSERPIVLLATYSRIPGKEHAELQVMYVNPHRETAYVRIYYVYAGERFVSEWLMPPLKQKEATICAALSVPITPLGAVELKARAERTASGANVIRVNGQRDSPGLFAPQDTHVPIYVAVGDRVNGPSGVLQAHLVDPVAITTRPSAGLRPENVIAPSNLREEEVNELGRENGRGSID